MKRVTKSILIAMTLTVIPSANLLAEESKKVTIEQMEIDLANLGAEIAKEKVKIYQKEALLNEMKLDLLKKKKERDSKK
ncbi:MAG TPA: hypothetical protein ENK99_05655 [Campylobacterales bacterium]|nr:hypothetical protein [Campylobacterales bacterium]HHD81055.1 hypothetical protein [Campylobacterales bacterium]